MNDQHEQLHGSKGEEQEKHTTRGHFEIGYWCLKDQDCESKKCAQVGPRKYDKECQAQGYVDFVIPEKKKRSHHRRDPEPSAAEAEQDDHEESYHHHADMKNDME